jgi:hypothetical protein
MAPAPDSWLRDRVLWLVVGVSTALRAFFAWRFFGFLSGDDVEILEEAFRAARGLQYSPWNVRNLFLPDVLVAPFVGLGSVLGLAETFPLVLCATVPFVSLASLNIVLVYRLVRLWLGDRTAARLAAGIYAFHWLPLAYGSAVYPRTISTTFVLGAALVLSSAGKDTTRGAAAGALLSLAFAVRYSEGMYLLPLLLLAQAGGVRRPGSLWRVLGVLGGFALGIVLVSGVVNALTWGSPFASLGALGRLMLLGEGASGLSTHPPFFYFQRIAFWLPPTLLPALILAWGVRRVRPVWMFVAVPLVLLSFVAHKELRYLQGAVPFLAILGAAGFAVMYKCWRPWLATTLVVLTLSSEVLGVRVLAGKSMAAVSAARSIASELGVRVVALSQAWAYGDRLYFGNRVELRGLPVPPREADLRKAIPGADRVAIYRKDLEENPSLVTVLASHGFTSRRLVEWGASKAVVVFARE